MKIYRVVLPLLIIAIALFAAIGARATVSPYADRGSTEEEVLDTLDQFDRRLREAEANCPLLRECEELDTIKREIRDYFDHLREQRKPSSTDPES